MSASGQGAPGDKKDEPKGFKKYMRRASLVLKSRSKRQSVSDASAFSPTQSPIEAGESSATAPSGSAAMKSAPTNTDPSQTKSVPAQISQVIKENKPVSGSMARVTPKEASAIQEEKARALFAKYGLTLEPGEWTAPVTGGAPRVEKQVRMRVHRTCHRCQTSFGSDRVCSNCQHTRCKKCPGRPKPKVTKGKGIAVDDGTSKTGEALTMPHRTSGKEMTRSVPTQRVRRTCHECQTLFVGKAVQCENCKHKRCPECPRDPPKKSKYPSGYPGDTGIIVPSGQEEGKTTQTGISSGVPRGNRPEDQAAVQSVEERMKSLDISPGASAA